MEDMARLALVEQSVKNINKFIEVLQELLRHINLIIDNPHDYDLRPIKSDVLKSLSSCEVFCNYLKYIGFQSVQNVLTFPKEETISKLRMAQAALQRKLTFCCGPSLHCTVSRPHRAQAKPSKLVPANIMTEQSPLLFKLQVLFNDVLAYENEELLQTARDCIPLVTLQLMALDRMREQQKKIKTGEIKGPDMSFDIALLMELLSWFKYKFFTWVDQPPCTQCGGETKFERNSFMKNETETCRVEIFKCTECEGGSTFPRYNNVRTLLRTRRGRCGEWANCFALLCRALGYDTRYVYDTTDHVWCEVYDYDRGRWVHADPCEAALDSPLLYATGWRKSLRYVLACSRDDLQDVTWRYTVDHKQVLSRRTEVSESDLLSAMLALREHRQAQLSPARRNYLAKRNLKELVELMVERTPSDTETYGRISGSRQWRTERGEIGGTREENGHTFQFSAPGVHEIEYNASADIYRISCDGVEQDPVKTWDAGVFECSRVFRKVEKDWRQVYLAREEGEEIGTIAWRISAEENLMLDTLSIKLSTAIYENGSIDWTIQFDEDEPLSVNFDDAARTFDREFRHATLRARLGGGRGACAWQHAQLFRVPLGARTSSLTIQARATTVPR